jgi:hypothetical protein
LGQEFVVEEFAPITGPELKWASFMASTDFKTESVGMKIDDAIVENMLPPWIWKASQQKLTNLRLIGREPLPQHLETTSLTYLHARKVWEREAKTEKRTNMVRILP